MGSDGGALMTIIMAAGAGLGGAVTVLFKIVMKQSDEQKSQAREIGEMKGYRHGIQDLSAKVLNTVHNAVSDKE